MKLALTPALLFCLLAAVGGSQAGTSDPLAQALALPQASLMLEEEGHPSIAHRADAPMVPASTMKILTALAAIERWGLDHRFHTDFYRGDGDWLWVKGGGDPYLVSEELTRIASALRRAGLRRVSGIGLDDGLFAPDADVAGRSSSNNPYDAPVTALAANFNTVAVVNKGGKIRSAEAQTPLTPLARETAIGLGPGTHRVNLSDRDRALRYFGELLAAKLEEAGIQVGRDLRLGAVPHGAESVYRHEGSRDLRTVVTAMLEFSSNFIANDLFLLLGGKDDGRGVTTAEAQRAADRWAEKTFGWRGHRIEDGAGLSRGNRLSARQLLEAVKAFAPYRDLLPDHKGLARAKTGTLTGVSCYAGFVRRNGRWEPFSLLINQPVSSGFRLQVAEALARAPDVARYCPRGAC
jgi:D-alanyl-D-alanine carboxypeptidase/D-alanyl-D-alanine-endopeptidase (penicillin-binding protein 4)